MVRANEADLSGLAAQVPPQHDNDARDLVLLLQARWELAMSPTQWDRVSRIVAGHSSMDTSLRIQLAWAYLSHTGRAQAAIQEVFRSGG